MGKYNDMLIEFMTEKNRIVKRITGLLIATKPDMDELRSWSEDACRAALSSIAGYPFYSDGKACPWCAVVGCGDCGYAKRNGECNNNYCNCNSRYDRITKRIRERTDSAYVNQLIGMGELLLSIQRKFRSIRVDKSDTHNTPKPPTKV